MVHQWRDTPRRGVSTVNITGSYRPSFDTERINGMGTFCDGDDCGPAESGGYVIHRPPCMTLASSRTDEENELYGDES